MSGSGICGGRDEDSSENEVQSDGRAVTKDSSHRVCPLQHLSLHYLPQTFALGFVCMHSSGSSSLC